MNSRRILLAILVTLLLVSAYPAVSQQEQSQEESRSAVAVLQLVQCSLAGSCREAGAIVREYEGVERVRVNEAYSELTVTYDPEQTSAEKMVEQFNREHPGSRLEVVDTASSESELRQRHRHRHRDRYCHYRGHSDII